MAYKSFFFFLFFLHVSITSLVAQPLQVGVTHFPPFFVVGTDGTVSGTLTNLIRRTLESADLRYVVESFPPKRLHENLSAGATDLTIGIKIGPLGEEGPEIYSQQPVSSIQLRIYALKTTPLPKEVEQLFGSQVGLIRGFQYGDRRALLSSSGNIPSPLNLNTHKNALSMLLSGRIDYLLDYKEPISRVIEPEQNILIHYKTLQHLDMFFVVSSVTSDAEKLMKILETTYQRD
jgi:polar amino acid transport system substrate-binding protein